MIQAAHVVLYSREPDLCAHSSAICCSFPRWMSIRRRWRGQGAAGTVWAGNGRQADVKGW